MRLLGIFLRIFALFATLTLAQAQAPSPRLALVIGNSDYSFAPLRNPVNDAEAMAKALEEAGFEVTVATDADQAAMAKAVSAFGEKLKDKGGIGLFYFSGHGAQISGENCLIPVSDSDADDIKSGSVTATEIVQAMAGAHNGLNIFILDACRTNPWDPNGSHGLSRIDSNASLFISYATSPGAVALDGTGNNSPYAKYLAEWIATPNLDLEDTFKRTLKGVYQDTKGEQTPWLAGKMLVIDWGDKTPVVYSFGEDGALDGEWADGSATETLTPVATSEDDVSPPDGAYSVAGRNAEGKDYDGTVTITKEGNDYPAELGGRRPVL